MTSPDQQKKIDVAILDDLAKHMEGFAVQLDELYPRYPFGLTSTELHAAFGATRDAACKCSSAASYLRSTVIPVESAVEDTDTTEKVANAE